MNDVVPASDLQEATARCCADILRASPMSIRASKECVGLGLEESGIEAAMKAQPHYPAFITWRNSDDAKEGPRAFAEKRAPVWTGR